MKALRIITGLLVLALGMILGVIVAMLDFIPGGRR